MKIMWVRKHIGFFNSVSNVWYECDFFQDSLEELKLVVRGSLFQVASLQDCFLQQSEPLATTSTGMGSWAICTPSSVQINPEPPSGLAPITERWTSVEHRYRMCLQKSGSCAKERDKKYFHCTFIFTTHEFGLTANGIIINFFRWIRWITPS